MEQRGALFCLVLLTLSRSDVGGLLLKQDVYTLPDNYDKSEPPNLSTPETADKPLMLMIRIVILDILSIEEAQNEISLDIAVYRSWVEHRLEFNNPPPEGTTYTVAGEDVDSFWIPTDMYIMGMRDLGFGTKGQNLRYLMLSRNKTVELLLRTDLIMRCKFDFQFYPFDSQVCKLDFTSLSRTAAVQLYAWQVGSSVSFRSDVMTSKVPKYQASVKPCVRAIVSKGLSGNSSALRVWVTLERELKPYLLVCYLPTSLFVFVSWGSFLVKPEVVPGRMVLLITTLLALVTLFEATRSQGPPASDINCMDIWLMCCILFVFMALLEYAAILMRIRGYFCFAFQQNKVGDLPKYYKGSTARQNQLQTTTVYPLDCSAHCKNKFHRFLTAFYNDTTGHLLDKMALVVFPAMFLLYNLVYWSRFLNIEAIPKECPQIDNRI